MFIKSQNKVIQVKDLQIFEYYDTKMSTDILEYTDTLTFQGFFAEDQQDGGNIPLSSQADNMTENA